MAKAGLDMKPVLNVTGKGAAQSWQMDHRGKTMIDDQFDFGFAVDWMRKDLRITLEAAKKHGAALPVTEMVKGYYGEVQQMGRRALGYLQPDPAPEKRLKPAGCPP